MSLSFLAKKSWHTLNVDNVEKVWIAEQAEEAEKAKLEAWKKEKEEERQIMELRELQGDMGGGREKKRAERVDFLYEDVGSAAADKQAYLLGKPIEIVPEESDVKKVEHLPGSNFLGVGQNNL